jgi:COMPASS component BRE2
VHISWLDRSAFLRLSADAASVTTDRGYRSGRANVSVREGTWYYEVVVERGDGRAGAGKGTGGDGGNAHVRVGWARREANLDAPVGADAYSYGIRDVGGERVHISRPKPYGRGFATGDVVGCLISLPPRPPVQSEDEPGFVKRWRIPLRYKGANYFEMDEYPVAKEMEALVNRAGAPAPAPVAEDHEPKKKVMKGGDKPATKKAAEKEKVPAARELRTLPGSSVRFFLNGEEMSEAPAFEDLYDFLPLPPNEEHRYVGPRRGPVSVERERESYQYHDDGTLGYFPMVSCFGRGKARVNFGPHWLKPPPVEVRPLAERWDEFRAEEVVYDEREEARLAQRYKDMVAEAARPREPKRPAKKRRKTPHDGETPASTPRMTPGVTPAPSSPKLASSPHPSSPSERGRSEAPEHAEIKPEPEPVKHEPGDDPHEGVSWD